MVDSQMDLHGLAVHKHQINRGGNNYKINPWGSRNVYVMDTGQLVEDDAGRKWYQEMLVL